jgi:hypothetical protein
VKPETCPNCGADVPSAAKACPDCGSCEETGWSEDAAVDGLNLPDETFNYDQYAQREFGSKRGVSAAMRSIWWWVAVGLLGLGICGWFLSR